MNRLHIGMTGGIGSGKNMAASLFEKHGFYMIDADLLVREVSAPNGTAYNGIVKCFGKDILHENGEINRSLLGSIVFSDPKKRLALENIVHPAIWDLERKKRGEILGKNSKALIITHAALLVETGSYKNYSPLIVVYCSKETQLKRIMKRNNFTEAEALARINAQLPMEEKLAHAQIIIDNDSDMENLEREVSRVSELIKLTDYAIKHS